MGTVGGIECFTMNEIDASLGLPTVAVPGMDVKTKYSDVFGFDFSSLDERSRRLLNGNGMHAAQIGAWWSFVCSHCVRKAHLETFDPPYMATLAIKGSTEDLEAMDQQGEDIE